MSKQPAKRESPAEARPGTLWGLWSDREGRWKPDPIGGPCQTYLSRAEAVEAAERPHNARDKYRPVQLEPIPF